MLDVRHLVDKGGNSSQAITDCIKDGAAALRADRTVIVACDFGVSRSNSIAAGILSAAYHCSLNEALARVLAATGEVEIKLDMIESVRKALSPKAARHAHETVLITGGAGFIGRNLVRRLRTCMRVAAPARETLNLEDGALRLANYCREEGVGQIVHLAYPRVYTNVGAMATGLAMLRGVLDTCKLLGTRLIYVSSAAVYAGYKTASLIADEGTPFRPKGALGDAKFLEEMLVAAYSGRGDVTRSICRLPTVYGPGGDRPRLIRSFQESIASGRTVQTHCYLNGRPALDLLHIGDAVDAIARTVEENANDIFHFGSGTLHTTVEIADFIARVVNRSVTFEELPIDDYIANIQIDTRKAQEMLNWRPVTSIQAGLTEMLTEDTSSKPGAAAQF